MRKAITYNEYLQLEGLFTCLKNNAREQNRLEAAAANILRSEKKEDNYDAAFILMDNMWDNPDTIYFELLKHNIEIIDNGDSYDRENERKKLELKKSKA